MNTASPTVDRDHREMPRSDAQPTRGPQRTETLARAELLLESGLVAAAAEIYAEVLEQEEVTAARYGLGRCAFLRSELHEALGHLQMVARSGVTGELANDLGVIYFLLGLIAEAREQLEVAVELAPRDAVAWRNLAAACEAAGDDDAMRAGLARALVLDPLG